MGVEKSLRNFNIEDVLFFEFEAIAEMENRNATDHLAYVIKNEVAEKKRTMNVANIPFTAARLSKIKKSKASKKNK